MGGHVSGRSTWRLPWTLREQAAHRKSYAARWRTLHMERDAQGASNCKWRGQKTTKPALATWDAQGGGKQRHVKVEPEDW